MVSIRREVGGRVFERGNWLGRGWKRVGGTEES